MVGLSDAQQAFIQKLKNKTTFPNSMKAKYILFAVLIILISLAIARSILPRQIDDVRPNRLCENDLVNSSSVLMVIPMFENRSIAENRSWCEQILMLNKTLGMHGVYHTEKEFSEVRDENYVKTGMEEFRKCFGFYPSVFEAPQLSLSNENEKLLKSLNFTILHRFHYLTHKVYHCTDYEKKSWLMLLNTLNKII
jgi:predicted deacetylase